jgi:RNA 2',3'-cyclic 3'-phosphodiesterase
MRRLFIAIKFTPDQRLIEAFLNIQKYLGDAPVKWVDSNNFHITLLFLGDTPHEKSEIIRQELRKIAPTVPSFEFQVLAPGYFTSHGKPRVIWFGIQDSEEGILSQLHFSIHRNFHIADDKEKTEFKPHLTIGRIKNPTKIYGMKELFQSFSTLPLQYVKVDSFQLLESKLTPAGPVYSVLEEFPLH